MAASSSTVADTAGNIEVMIVVDNITVVIIQAVAVKDSTADNGGNGGVLLLLLTSTTTAVSPVAISAVDFNLGHGLHRRVGGGASRLLERTGGGVWNLL